MGCCLSQSVTHLVRECSKWRMWKVEAHMELEHLQETVRDSQQSWNYNKHFTKASTLPPSPRSSRDLLLRAWKDYGINKIKRKKQFGSAFYIFIFFLFEFGGFCDFSGLIILKYLILFHSNNSCLGITYRYVWFVLVLHSKQKIRRHCNFVKVDFLVSLTYFSIYQIMLNFY